MSPAPAPLTGTQKAALVLLEMGTERSAKVMRMLRETEVTEITSEIARMRSVDSRVVDDVVAEFDAMHHARESVTAGGIDMARQLLEKSLGSQRAAEILERVMATMVHVPFEFLRQADPRQVLGFIQDEHPQTVALVLAHMSSKSAAMVLGGLPEDIQLQVAQRLALMDRTSPEVIEQVEKQLERKLSTVLQPTEMSTAGGVQSLVDILNRSDRGTERIILEGLERADETLADEVRQRMFLFTDIGGLDDRSVQLILRQVDTKQLAIALKGVDQSVRQKIVNCMSERAGQNLVEEIELLGAVRLKQVEEAQSGIIRVIRALEESGQLVLTRSADEFVV
jgi:flagellar motor switch protein FliG